MKIKFTISEKFVSNIWRLNFLLHFFSNFSKKFVYVEEQKISCHSTSTYLQVKLVYNKALEAYKKVRHFPVRKIIWIRISAVSRGKCPDIFVVCLNIFCEMSKHNWGYVQTFCYVCLNIFCGMSKHFFEMSRHTLKMSRHTKLKFWSMSRHFRKMSRHFEKMSRHFRKMFRHFQKMSRHFTKKFVKYYILKSRNTSKKESLHLCIRRKLYQGTSTVPKTPLCFS